MKINHKYSFEPKYQRNKDIRREKSYQNKNSINKLKLIQLQEPKEESFHFLSPRKTSKIKLEEEDDDIYKTEMANKKPLELFQDIQTDIPENNKTLQIKRNFNLNNYDCDNNPPIEKSFVSTSFSKIIMDENISNDKIDDINNSIVKYNTVYTIEESKNNIENKDTKKLMRFCQSMMNKKNKSKILKIYNIYNKSKKIQRRNNDKIKDNRKLFFNTNYINNYKEGDNIYNHISFFKNLNNNKYTSSFSNLKSKLIKKTPRNHTYINTNEDLKDICFESQNDNMAFNKNAKISFDKSVSFCNKSYQKYNSAFHSARAYSSIHKKPKNINNQNSLYIDSSRRNNKNSKNNIRSFSYTKFIYKKRIIKMNKNKDTNNIHEENKTVRNESHFINTKLNTKSFRNEKDLLNTFRLNIKPIKKQNKNNEVKLESKKEKPINLKNTNFYSGIYESLLGKQKENCKNNIIIQNFNNYNLNTYNSNKNISPNFINFDVYTKNNSNEERMNKITDKSISKTKNVILEIKINKRCFSKNIDHKHKKLII